jgi:5-bromo-4-chloroindolyl phosphate hydrolysis protein
MAEAKTPPAGMRAVTKKSALPIYAIGAVWVLWSLFFPLYSLSHYIPCLILSLAVFLVLTKVIPDKVTYEPIPVQVTGYESADELLKAGDAHLRTVRELSAKIDNTDVRAKVDRLGGTCQRIFDYVRQNPKSADELRKFMNYYLPTLEKLVKTYELMEEHGVEGENITASKARISQMLDTMDAAFRKQLDALFGDTALDIDTDITVMEGMMAQEGLTDAGKMPTPEEIKPLQEETFQAGDIKLEL